MKRYLLLISCFCFIVLLYSVYGQISSSPSPSISTTPLPTPSPTSSATPSPSSSPSATPACSGLGAVFVRDRINLDLNEEDSDKIIEEAMKESIKRMHETETYKDAISCKLPESFECPSYCMVQISENIFTSLTGHSVTNIQAGQCKSEGTFSLFYGIFHKYNEENLAADSAKKFTEAINNALRNCNCPFGSTKSINLAVKDIDMYYGWQGLKYGLIVEVSYEITITCLLPNSNPYVTDTSLANTLVVTKICVERSQYEG